MVDYVVLWRIVITYGPLLTIDAYVELNYNVDDYGQMLLTMHSCGRLCSIVKDYHHIWSTIDAYVEL